MPIELSNNFLMTKVYSAPEQLADCGLDNKHLDFILLPQGCSLRAQKVTTQYRMKIRHLKDQIL